jgi:hypothetical protein
MSRTEQPNTELTGPAERERHLPLINVEEQRFIENTGGAYTGYIRSTQGQRKYERFRIDRRAHYDEDRRAIIETYVATEAIDGEGENELNGPEDVLGFSILIRELSLSGEQLSRPIILKVLFDDFKAEKGTQLDVANLERDLHAMVVNGTSTSKPEELMATVRNTIKSLGWNED